MTPNSMRLAALVLVLTAVLHVVGQTPQPKAHMEGVVLDGPVSTPLVDCCRAPMNSIPITVWECRSDN
jgi:hypothetical protein